ncbi:MAG: hypothetical protein UT13_C0001G0140 [Candidatus Pacebacteria bacterium GW2011_GWF2_38_9]|nr:MAG: hypothetical protein US01_C0001G0141 [candidate division TM6 bacterium GW2011_GWF2_28_16]KKQ09114.1 MAG: hypothetical protein US20_C0009G0015 [Candidatus Pacebacteria bacterium GW2011_GWF1_36_5]KKQ88493.1 MAG: hypothetical protein UT13_C0001G0140 [Candidatus Pacebacteria bacterium GW2011_GWF2_38_9]HAZ73372.1 hypothetical protein [Candidatus Paceibacterota bacterium]
MSEQPKSAEQESQEKKDEALSDVPDYVPAERGTLSLGSFTESLRKALISSASSESSESPSKTDLPDSK